MNHLKDGVQIAIMTPQLLDGILKAYGVYMDAGEEFFITSLTDGKHMDTSLHYKGNAFDLRTWNLKHKTPYQMIDLLKAKLGKDYDVIVEKDHIHAEHQAK